MQGVSLRFGLYTRYSDAFTLLYDEDMQAKVCDEAS